MRSHMTLLSPSPHAQKPPQNESPSSSSSSASSSSEEGEAHKAPNYGLRENPQKSFRFADPEFSFALDASSVVQDRESETESPHRPHRRRSKRHRVSPVPNPKPETEPELLSSVSDATTEEDVALCLMMLSRDIWMRDSSTPDFESQDSKGEEEEEEDQSRLLKVSTKRRTRFQCETCKKVFSSYQALGGHRASHKKIRSGATDGVRPHVADCDGEDRRKIHQCPICSRVFSSGQALGGHRRSHLSAPPAAASQKFTDNSIDLNLPAPVEDDDVSQVELSAVSDVAGK